MCCYLLECVRVERLQKGHVIQSIADRIGQMQVYHQHSQYHTKTNTAIMVCDDLLDSGVLNPLLILISSLRGGGTVREAPHYTFILITL